MRLTVECNCGNVVKYVPKKEKGLEDSYYFLLDVDSKGYLSADDSGFVQFYCGECGSLIELKM